MNKPWQDLAAEIARWSDAGRVVEFWWRDDDAARPNAAFQRLVRLASQSRVPLGLAVIPSRAQAELFAALDGATAVLMHGVDHVSRTPPDQKPSEFPESEAVDVAAARIAEGRRRLATLAETRLLPIMVPPWNRFPRSLAEHLPRLALRGLSAFGPRARAEPVPGLIQVNTHVDIIAWRRGRTFVGEDRALNEAAKHLADRRTGKADAAEPTGWLTHHERHDETIWTFLARLFEFTRAQAGVRWLHPGELLTGARSR